MSWNLNGSYFETCSCDVVCPCTASLALGATRDRCNVTLVFNISEGDVEGTDVSGLTVAAVADTPKVMTEGNWRLGGVIYAAASAQQAEKRGAVFSGARRREPGRRASADRRSGGGPAALDPDRR